MACQMLSANDASLQQIYYTVLLSKIISHSLGTQEGKQFKS